jgi:hypothetical protein
MSGLFLPLAVVSSPAVNVGVQLKSTSAGSVAILYLIFQGIAALFPIEAMPLYIPPVLQKGFCFSTSLPALAFCFVLVGVTLYQTITT